MNLVKIRKELAKRLYLYTGIRIAMSSRFSLRDRRIFKQELKLLKQQAQHSSVAFPVTGLLAFYDEKGNNAGDLLLHYFFQDLYVAQRIFQNRPILHIDIGSRIDGFVAHVASFREIEVLDIRPLETILPNIRFKQADLMNLEEKDYERSDSISCLHALEHFGLGRYGDPICYEGYLSGFINIHKMLQAKGKLYFSVPMGPQRIEFHAHRVFSLRYLLEMIEPLYHIDRFSYVDDNNCFYENVSIKEENIADNFGCRYGCAIFELTKK